MPNKFFAWIGLGILGLVLLLFGLGAVLTQFLWSPEKSQPVVTQPQTQNP